MNGFPWLGRRHVVPETETPLQLARRLPDFRVDPRLVHSTETEPAEADTETPVEAEVPEMPPEEIQAHMDRQKARVEASRRAPVVPSVRSAVAGAVDLGATIAAEVAKALAAERRAEAERQRRAAEAKARAEREEQERMARGGPCQYCGLVLSWERDENGQPVGRWYDDGETCTWCESDRTDFSLTGNGSALEHRARILRKYILPQEVTKYWYNEGLLEKCKAFRWWRDMPGAATVEHADERFAYYVDRAPLIEALESKPTEYATRQPCPRCGCPSRWFWTRTYQPAGSGQVAVETWTCMGCRDSGDLVMLTSRTTGLTPWKVESLGTAAAEVLGVHWWADDPNGGKADPPQPCEVPFGYVDGAAARRVAFRLFPGERAYGNPAAWQAAKAAQS